MSCILEIRETITYGNTGNQMLQVKITILSTKFKTRLETAVRAKNPLQLSALSRSQSDAPMPRMPLITCRPLS